MGSVFVISDLHIASGPLDDCDDQLQDHFQSFLEHISRRSAPTELVINGDFLDFVQAEPWSISGLESSGDDEIPLCFTEQQSIAKLESIHAAHKPAFDTLAHFLKSHPAHSVTVMPGNHDADFYFEGARKRFTELVGAVHFFLEPVYRPAFCPSVWIEHGHQSDPVNCFIWRQKPYWSAAAPPIFKDREGTPRLFECTGTRFLIQFMNRLDRDYPFVDNVKPFSRFVRIFGASAFMPGYGTLKVAVTVARLLVYLYSTVMHHDQDVLGIDKETNAMMYYYLAHQFKTLPKARTDAFRRQLAEHGFIPEMPLEMYFSTPARAEPLLAFLSDHSGLLDELEIPGASFLGSATPGTLTLAQGFSVDETKALMKTAGDALANAGVALVLMGHTHEPVPRSGKPYINTGCWTRYYRFDASDTASWKVLQTDSYLTFPYELKYVEIADGNVASAQLATYKNRHA